MNHMPRFQMAGSGDGRVSDGNRADGVALFLYRFSAFAADGARDAGSELQIVICRIHHGVDVHLRDVALLDDNTVRDGRGMPLLWCNRHADSSSLISKRALLIIINPSSGLASQPPLLHQLAQQGAGAILLS